MRIHITGDSLAARFEGGDEPMLNHLLKQKIAGLEVTNTAVSGNNTRDVLERLNRDILSKPAPDWFFLLIGANDLASHKQLPLVEFKKNLGEFLLAIQAAYPQANLCLISPPPVDESKQEYRRNQTIETYVSAMEEISVEFSCSLINLYQLFQEVDVALSVLMDGLAHDGLHFGKVGYDLLATAMLAVIDRHI